MADCCDRAYKTIFDEKGAAGDLRRYRRKGLDKTARRLVDVLESKGLTGASIIEVGGGIGVIVVELLTRGAARAISAELVASYESAATDLLEERGLSERAERRVLDFARESAQVPAADIVVLHRVVCCYPDAPALVSAAAAHATRILAMTFPPDRWWWRFIVRIENALMRVSRQRLQGVCPQTQPDRPYRFRGRTPDELSPCRHDLADRHLRARVLTPSSFVPTARLSMIRDSDRRSL